MIQTWRVDTREQTIVLASKNRCLPSVVYWGAVLPMDEDLELIFHGHIVDVTGGMLDENPELSICPEAVRSFPGHPGLIIRDEQAASLLPKFSFEREQQDRHTLTLSYQDVAAQLCYIAVFESYMDSNIIKMHAEVKSEKPIYIDWLAAPVLPVSSLAKEMIDFSGRWCGEFQQISTPWQAGIRCRENRTGRTGHEHFPGLIVPLAHTTYTRGSASIFHYGWSGGHKMIAEELQDGRRQVQFGHASRTELYAGHFFSTAPLYVSSSQNGINGCALAMQKHVRKHIVKSPKPEAPKPVYYNCWEAVYFHHNLETLKDIAARAATLGAERFVLDDGWFGTRDDDTKALSEWEVDTRAYPDGLQPLIDHVHSKGMSFGIWFEPEMISPASTLYKTHPHWALGAQDQILGRSQKVLNMALPEVRDYLFHQMQKILSAYDIDYIKWDHNRVLPIADTTQTKGTYDLLQRIRVAFPTIEIESCASGGGRIDFGILSHTQRVWLSDSNDAQERAKIQRSAALFLPSSITGSHVGPRTCHTSHRTIPMHFRAWIAAQRHMGIEMDPRELTESETQVLSSIIEWWKSQRQWLMHADIHLLESGDPSVLAELHMAEDGKQFVLFANKIDTASQIAPKSLCLTALEKEKMYTVTLVNRNEIVALSRGTPYIKFEDMQLSGQYLMHHGIHLPWSFPHQTWVIKGMVQHD